MSHSCDLTVKQLALLDPMLKALGKRGSKYVADLRSVVDARAANVKLDGEPVAAVWSIRSRMPLLHSEAESVRG